MDTLLNSLSREQLIELVKEALAQGVVLGGSIKRMVQANLASGMICVYWSIVCVCERERERERMVHVCQMPCVCVNRLCQD